MLTNNNIPHETKIQYFVRKPMIHRPENAKQRNKRRKCFNKPKRRGYESVCELDWCPENENNVMFPTVQKKRSKSKRKSKRKEDFSVSISPFFCWLPNSLISMTRKIRDELVVIWTKTKEMIKPKVGWTSAFARSFMYWRKVNQKNIM